MKIVTIIGARPQFIKAAVISREIQKDESIEEIIVHTGQHYDANMSEIFFKEMDIPKPHYNLGINHLSHGAMTGQMIEKIEEILLKEKPDWTLVYGDTDSTLAGALAASKLHIKIAHIEAGLRSFNMNMPEEINRILTDRLSTILFCPSEQAIKNLQDEGFNTFPCKIIKTGDVMYDAAMYYKAKSKKPTYKIPKNYILCTIHRAENTDSTDNITNIFSALEEIASFTPIVIPLHPRTQSALNKIDYNYNSSNITFIPPVGYFEMLWLISYSNLIMTDSGGLQKEAYFFKKKCITLRDETEWIELLHNNCNILVGANKEKIIETEKEMRHNTNADFSAKLYGDSKAGYSIINEIKYF